MSIHFRILQISDEDGVQLRDPLIFTEFPQARVVTVDQLGGSDLGGSQLSSGDSFTWSLFGGERPPKSHTATYSVDHLVTGQRNYKAKSKVQG